MTWLELPESPNSWCVGRSHYDPAEDSFYEALLHISNGHYGLRSTLDFGSPQGSPGFFSATTYGAGLSAGRQIVNTVNPAFFDIELNGEHLGALLAKATSFSHHLDLRHAYTTLALDVRTQSGVASIRLDRLMPPGRPYLISIATVQLTAAGDVTLHPGISYGHSNASLAGRQDAVRIHHLQLETMVSDGNTFGVLCRNRTDSRGIAVCNRLIHSTGEISSSSFVAGGVVVRPVQFRACNTAQLVVLSHFLEGENDVALLTAATRNASSVDPALLLADHLSEWRDRWQSRPLRIDATAALEAGVKYGSYQLLQLGRPAAAIKNVPARGLSSEYHSGHFFFNTEYFLGPYFCYADPNVARDFIRHRIERLDAAKLHASATGYKGARFPEESDDLGNPAAPHQIYDLFTQESVFEWSGIEVVHTSADVMYSLYHYLQCTGDTEFLVKECVPLVLECATYLASVLKWSTAQNAFTTTSVMGFDEFHYHVDDHFATNWLCKWSLEWVLQLLVTDRAIQEASLKYLSSCGEVAEEVFAQWRLVASKTLIPSTTSQVYPPFSGYFDLPDQLKDDHAPVAHSNMAPDDTTRADRMEPFTTRLLKQSDVLFPMVLFPGAFDDNTVKANLDFYECRTVHGSSLSMSTHAAAAIRAGDSGLAVRLLAASLQYNLDYQPRSHYKNGVHVAGYAGAFVVMITSIAGLSVDPGTEDVAYFDPKLPDEVRSFSCRVWVRGRQLDIVVSHDSIVLRFASPDARPLHCLVRGERFELTQGGVIEMPLPRR